MMMTNLGVKAKFKESMFMACLVYTYVTTLFIVVIGSICVAASNNIQAITVTSAASNLQVVADWQTVPFTEIKIVESGDGCGDGYSPIFTRTWFGMTTACDC